MSYWQGIIACGLENQNQISLEYLFNEEPDMARVVQEVIRAFGQVFGYEMQVNEGVLVI
jgi:lipoate-protein ligase B